MKVTLAALNASYTINFPGMRLLEKLLTGSPLVH